MFFTENLIYYFLAKNIEDDNDLTSGKFPIFPSNF